MATEIEMFEAKSSVENSNPVIPAVVPVALTIPEPPSIWKFAVQVATVPLSLKTVNSPQGTR